ncbi:MAG: magnesium/cobalt transporter CorA [Planctomycetes bacterium]|nr:magnesium/cobalt transporter CorA [Planctomycetota bacterium]
MKKSLFHRRSPAVGAAPGQMWTPTKIVQPHVRVMTWNESELEDRELDPAELPTIGPVRDSVRWVDVQGLGDGSLIAAFGEKHDLHPLAIADVVNVGQRPKAELYGDDWFLVVRMASMDGDDVHLEQVSMFLFDGMVITFQEREGDCLGPLRDRIHRSGKRIRSGDSYYLTVMVIDAIVDGYFPVLEALGETLEELEELVVEHPKADVLERIYRMKRELLTFRRAIWPLRETLSQLMRDESFPDEVNPYLRDATDHVAQVTDIVETYREIAGSFVDVYLSSVGQKTNETMRVLTVISTIFIPLTFVAGVYGMNFDTQQPGNMPELLWPYGYLLFWAICIVLSVSLLILFRRLGWLGGQASIR